ncbi:MAG: DNA polymerase domain-containing protein [Thermoplasmatota archaeon]
MPSSKPAWLFDVYPHPTRSSLLVWVKHGSRTYRREIPYQCDFLLRADAAPLEVAEDLLKADPRVERMERARARLWLQTPDEEVLRVRPFNLHDIHWIATDLRKATDTKGFLFFDVDHAPESRWMHANGLFAMCRIDPASLTQDPRSTPAPPRLYDGEDRWTLDYPSPPLRTLRLEAHAVGSGVDGTFESPLSYVDLNGTRIASDASDSASERRALLEMGRYLAATDPDVIITRHGDRWDIPYLLRRIRAQGLVDQVRLGRDPDPNPDRPDQAAKSIHTYGRWLFKTHAYYLRGRWHIDLSKKTLDSDDDRKDLHGIVYLSRVSNRRSQDINRNGAGYALQQMQIDSAIDQGVALPWKRNLAEDWKDAATLCAVDRGGQIVNPTPGLYEDVAACDFSGYYPSIVVEHNLSSDTINCTCCPEGPRIPELGMHVCTRRRGHQSEILRRLAPHRRLVKAILWRAEADPGSVEPDLIEKAKAIKAEQKALGVVCFGYFRYRNARFGCAEVHQAIQAYGRAGMTRARSIATEMGFDMIHSLTDSVFLAKPGVTRQEAMRVARRIAREVRLPMDVEGVYRWLVLLPSKTHSTTSEVGVPTRYYGLFEDGRMKVRGIDVQRHITPGWIYDAQQAMLDVFAQARNAAEFLDRIPESFLCARRAAERLMAREVDADDLGLMVQTTQDVESYVANTHTRHALLALEAAGIHRNPGEYVKYVVVRRQGSGAARAMPVELFGRESAYGAMDARQYDIEFYLRLLARSIETLLSPFGYEEGPVLEWLAGRAPTPKVKSSRLATRRLHGLRYVRSGEERLLPTRPRRLGSL